MEYCTKMTPLAKIAWRLKLESFRISLEALEEKYNLFKMVRYLTGCSSTVHHSLPSLIIHSHPVCSFCIRACHRLPAGLSHAAGLCGREQKRFG